jgi:hypothetical protein
MHPTREGNPVSSTSKLRRATVLALAGASLAIGVPAALAAGGDVSSSAGTAAPAVERFVQDEQTPPDRGDCPERERSGDEASGRGSGGGGAAPESSATPDTSV